MHSKLKTAAEKRIDLINKNLRVSTDYLKNLEKNAENTYKVWLSLNEHTADGTTITMNKVEMLNKKLEYQKSIIEQTKSAYEEIKALSGEFSAQSVSAQSQYMEMVNSYLGILAERNTAIGDNNLRIKEEVLKQNQEIDKQNQKKFGVTAKTEDKNDFTYVNGIVEKFNEYIVKNKDIYLKVGGTYDDFMALAKKVTGYDKVEEAYRNGKTGGVPDLIPYVDEPVMPDYNASSEIKVPSFDEEVINDSYQNGFLQVLGNTSSLINEELSEKMTTVGENSIKGILEGMQSELLKSEDELELLGKAFTEKIIAGIDKQQIQNVINNYQSSYTISGSGESAEKQLEDFERYEELKKMRGSV